ncbi:MAG: YbbR-like domain-containing protein [Lachnospiraceae bacterium]|nr:YbbR-like domain-containing protein [Lachnospiraceae bacterium]
MKKVLGFLWSKFSHNWWLKVLAIVISTVMWFMITNNENPVIDLTFYELPVNIVNESHITQMEKTYDIMSGEKIDVVVKGRTSAIAALEESDIIVTADFDKISMTGNVPIDVTIQGQNGKELEVIRKSSDYMKLSIEDYSFKEYKVSVDTIGEPAEGFVQGNIEVSPSVITVSGTKTQLSRIRKVAVTVVLDDLAGNTTLSLKPIAYDNDNEIINSEKLDLSVSTVQVTANIYKTKTVNIYGYTLGEVAEGYELGSVLCYPSTIEIAGTNEDLKEIGYNLKAYVDVTGATQDVEKSVPLDDLIDETLYPSVIILTDDATVVVKAGVTEQQQKELTLSAADIAIQGLGEGLKADIRSLTTRKVVVKATRGWLEGLTISGISPAIDLSDITVPGRYMIPVTFADYQGIDILTDVTAVILVEPVEPGEKGAED